MALFARTSRIFIVTNRNYSKLISSVRKSVTWQILPSQLAFCGHIICRQSSTKQDNTKRKDVGEFVSFDTFINKRTNEAKRSILVQVRSDADVPYLHKYCSNFGHVECMYYYSPFRRENHILVEFKDESMVKEILRTSTHVNIENVIPVTSSVLFFRQTKSQHEASSKTEIPLLSSKQHPNENTIINKMRSSKTASHQIENCYSLLKLDDLGLRLRFYTSYQIECCFSGIFPRIQAHPFGSTVNGFGKKDCDLDLYLNLDIHRAEDRRSKLVFQTKLLEHNNHRNTDLLRIIGGVLKIVTPGFENVINILQARVPIIKFDNVYTGVQCDLSLSNMSAIYMSELLYLYGEIDHRVRPIVFVIRKWARNMSLTSEIPCAKITNFSLTLLTLFFFQSKKILPTLLELRSKAQNRDVRITKLNVDSALARDIQKFRNQEYSELDSFTLLKEFYEFYATFHFKSKGICLIHGIPIDKRDDSALFIRNPLDQSLNVSKNVSHKEIEQLQLSCRAAVWKLENSSTVPDAANWGILSLFTDDVKETDIHTMKNLKTTRRNSDSSGNSNNKKLNLHSNSNLNIKDLFRFQSTAAFR